MKRKICVVVTARPSYSRIKTVLTAIKEHADLELQLVVAASALLDRYGDTIEFIEKDGFKVDSKVFITLEGENLITSAKSVGLALVELPTVFDRLKPDIVITIADRFETIATAVAASYMNIPLAHLQGGEITGSIDEKVRHAITKFADIHFVATDKAAERVIRMGEDPQKVFRTGCPSIDIAADVLKNPVLDFDPQKKYSAVGPMLDLSNGYLVVLQHPVTTEYGMARQQIEETLFAVNDVGISTLWFWPNVDAGSDGVSKGIRAFREYEKPKSIRFYKNMLPNDFLKLIYNSKCIIGNSSVAIRECAYLGIPAVNIGSRQSGRERGANVFDVDYNRISIAESIRNHLENGKPNSDHLYGDGEAGIRIADILSKTSVSIEKKLTY
ncbi:UDP-N-acetylglucosamine 2-epimerase (hydrolyzing) [bacterium]|nr:UDP-N-acetylglucosamine 2-epimerase (hydrolyzing) [bacterium]